MSDTINFGTARCGPNEAPIDPAQAFAERAARIEAVRSMLPKQGGIAGRGDDALALLRLQPQLDQPTRPKGPGRASRSSRQVACTMGR